MSTKSEGAHELPSSPHSSETVPGTFFIPSQEVMGQEGGFQCHYFFHMTMVGVFIHHILHAQLLKSATAHHSQAWSWPLVTLVLSAG
jgi:hypothetical protein